VNVWTARFLSLDALILTGFNATIFYLQARELMREIAEIVNHLHSKNIAHRDLKPENFLYTQKGGGVLKLADFGFAKVDHGDLTTPVFTPYYVPKEILKAQVQQLRHHFGSFPSKFSALFHPTHTVQFA